MNGKNVKFNPAVLDMDSMKDYQLSLPPLQRVGHFLYPGSIFVSADPVTVSTILGSCAAVCLWDKQTRIGGLNHYLLPEGPADSPNRLRYGNIANPTLLKEMLSRGCRIGNLQARIFGGSGAFAANPILSVGTRNVEAAELFLRDAGIVVVGREVSGKHGRRLLFSIGDGVTTVKSYENLK